MKKLIAALLALTLTLTLSACGADSGNATETPTTQDELVDYIEQHTTTVENPDGTTTITWSSGTERPAIPTGTTTSYTTKRRPSTTTMKPRSTTSTHTGSTVIVTEKSTTTTTTKPAPIPTMPTTTKPVEDVTTAPVTSTTKKAFAYQYTQDQQHTWLALEDRYYYSLLSEEWKGYYRQLDEAVRYLDASVFFDTDLTQDRKHVLYFIYMYDTPELFFLSATTTISHRGDGTSGFLLSYSVGRGEGEFCGYGYALREINDALRQKIRAKQEKFDNAVYTVTNTIPTSAPDVVKERMIYDIILKTSAYNLPAAMGNPDAVGGRWDGLACDNWTAYGIIVTHTGVCESYAEAFQTLCNAVGIPCTGIDGTAGGGHKWNAIKLSGQWYMCDITFDDPIGGDPDDAYHTYFNLTDAKMREMNHQWSANKWDGYFSTLTYPKCNSTQYNWGNFVNLYGE